MSSAFFLTEKPQCAWAMVCAEMALRSAQATLGFPACRSATHSPVSLNSSKPQTTNAKCNRDIKWSWYHTQTWLCGLQSQEAIKHDPQSVTNPPSATAEKAGKPDIAGASEKPASEASKLADGLKPGASHAAGSSSGKTVFVRSLPADVSKDQLQIAFRRFGTLRACRSAAQPSCCCDRLAPFCWLMSPDCTAACAQQGDILCLLQHPLTDLHSLLQSLTNTCQRTTLAGAAILCMFA